MTEPEHSSQPGWPAQAIFPPRGLSPDEEAIQPHSSFYEGSRDAYPLALLSWLSPTRPAKGRIIVLHGVQSHAGWYHGLGKRLAAAGFDAPFPDRRGSGANTRQRGHADKSIVLIEDIVRLADNLQTDGSKPAERASSMPFLAGISWGGKLAVVTAARYPAKFAGVALLCPGLKPRVGVPRGERYRIALAKLTARAGSVTFPIPLSDPELFTADGQARVFIAQDPLSLRQATAGLLASSFFLDQAVRRAARYLKLPVLLMLAEHDRIVDNEQTRAYFERIAGTQKQLIHYDGAHHTLEFEPDPGRYARDLLDWMNRVPSA